jgi:hypothetical protein
MLFQERAYRWLSSEIWKMKKLKAKVMKSTPVKKIGVRVMSIDFLSFRDQQRYR